ncbi:hypothetical protein CJ178_13165 [Rhodococcus sp. ACPA4]|uniref:oligosaccharide flippase family protein n=1 Tax=Rhodococcus sp. ACPA4 TaxID=2028571 RepID=UPI000BB0EB5D|nr:oligosaccharide flippase family protein [Rhodococcus sp. ACPA4]PBC42412.1 hypothetical protein CJ178_13165 [Rhodococcus sp. ACPA4]
MNIASRFKHIKKDDHNISTEGIQSSARSEKIRGILAYGLGPILGLLSGPILAHAMGPEGRGQFAAIMQPISVAGAIASIGIPGAAAYFIARDYDPKRIFLVSLKLSIIPIAVVMLAMAWYGRFVSDRQEIDYGFIMLCWSVIAVSAIVQIKRGYWQGLGDWKRLDLERSSFALLRFSAVAIVALLGAASAIYFSAAALFAFILSALILFVPLKLVFKAGKHIGVQPIAKYALFASAGTIATIASSRLDQLLMPATTSSVELGYYAIAVTVAEVPLVLAALASRNSLRQAARGDGNRLIAKECLMFFVASVSASFLVFMLANPIIPIVFGESFTPSVQATRILAIASVAGWISIVAGSVVAGRGYPGLSSIIALSALAVTLCSFAIFWNEITSVKAANISLLSSVVAASVGLVLVSKLKARSEPTINLSMSDARETS